MIHSRRYLCHKTKGGPDDVYVSPIFNPDLDCLRAWHKDRPAVYRNAWPTAESIQVAINACQSIKNELTHALAKLLNVHYKCNRTIRQWDILLGPWLTQFVQVVFDRRKKIESCIKNETNPIFIVDVENDITLYETSDFELLARSYELNTVVYGEIVKSLGVDYECIATEDGKFTNTCNRPFLLRLLKMSRAFLLQYVGIFCTYGLYFTYHSRREQFLNYIKSVGKVSGIAINWTCKRVGKDKKLREHIRNELKKILSFAGSDLYADLICKLLPTALLEGYELNHRLANKYLDCYLPNLKVLCSGTAWYYDEPFKYTAVELLDRGGLLWGMQHGGVYGSAKYSSSECHELSICDVFFTWGWSYREKCCAIPSPKLDRSLRRIPKRILPSNRGYLFVSTCWHNDTFDFPYTPDAFVEYCDDQIKFFSNLNPFLRNEFRVRAYSQDYGWGLSSHFEKLVGKQSIESWNFPYLKSLASSKIVIFDHLSTTFLEAIAADVPCIMYVNQKIWPLRDESDVYINSLKVSNIFFSTPEGAADWLNQCPDIEIWWNSEVVRDARNIFMRNQALTSKETNKRFYDLLVDRAFPV